MFEEARGLKHKLVILPSSRVQDELLAELEELEQEELNKKMTNIRLPSVPSSSLPAQPVRTPGPAGTAPRPRAGVSLPPRPNIGA